METDILPHSVLETFDKFYGSYFVCVSWKYLSLYYGRVRDEGFS